MPNPTYIFKSKRLGFRTWLQSDLEPFYNMCNDADVMKYFPAFSEYEKCKNFIPKMNETFAKNKFCLFAVDVLQEQKFIGYIGFGKVNFKADFTPCIEIGWRLQKQYWNKGFATEGALACLNYSFNKLNINKIYSFTSKLNKASEKVMQKIGMQKIGEFNHPKIDKNHKLSLHVLYVIEKES